MIKPGDYVLSTADFRYTITIPALVLVMCGGDCLTHIALNQSQDMRDIAWSIQRRDIIFCRDHYASIPNIEEFIDNRVFWICARNLITVPSVEITLPDDSIQKLNISPEFDKQIILNNKKYIISEISEDKTKVWVEHA